MHGDTPPFETIKAWADAHIVTLIQEETGVELNRHGRMPCPLHQGTDPNFAVGDGGFCCHSTCGERGDAIRFLVLHRGLPDSRESRVEVMRSLASRAGVVLGGAPESVRWTAARTVSDRGAPVRAPDPFKPTKPTPNTSAMNGGESLSAYPVNEPRALAVYPYARTTGEVVAIKVRKPHPTRGKSFSWHHTDGRISGQHDPLPDEYRELVYRLPELHAAAGSGETLVLIGEGEKVVDALRSVGFTATSHHGGASATWGAGHARHLAPFSRVVLFPDNDLAGRDHMTRCAAALAVACPRAEVRSLTLKNEWGDTGIGDVADFVAAARAKGWADARIHDELQRRIDDAFASAPVATAASEGEDGGESVPDQSEHEQEQRANYVRTLTDAALYGPLGAWVRVWQPHTEASPLALFAVALAALGAAIGRGAFLLVNADAHAPRLFVLLVGPSGRARKGVTIGIVSDLLARIDHEFATTRVSSGLSTTEGLVHLLRDPTPERMENGKVIPAIPGTTDKRLLVIEEEFASVLRVMRRKESDLSATLRAAWDGRPLRRLTKGDPMTATDPHVAIVGAITPSELREQLQSGDVFNGFANRLLPIYAASEQCIPFPGSPAPFELNPTVDQLAGAVKWARAQRGEFSMNAEAKCRWEALYKRLRQSNAQAEAVRALHERAAPYVLRVALLLAMLDRSRVVTVAHLDAAAALWQLAEGAWAKVYPDTPREGLAGKIERALCEAGPAGLTRTGLRDCPGIGNSVKGAEISRALTQLAEEGLAVKLPPRPRETGGRAAEVWVHAWHQPASYGDPGSEGDTGENGDKPLSSISPIPPISPMLPFAETEQDERVEGEISQDSHISHVSSLRERDEQLDREWGDDAA